MNEILEAFDDKTRKEFYDFCEEMLIGSPEEWGCLADWYSAKMRSALTEQIEEIYKKMDEYEFHKDEIHCTCLGALREWLKESALLDKKLK